VTRVTRRTWRVAVAAATAAALAAPALTAPARADDFIAGSGAAAASTMQLGPKAGGLALTQIVGESLAGYIGTAAQAESQLLDTGLLGTLLTAKHCDGTNSLVTSDQLPQETRVDSRDPNADKGQSKTYAATPAGDPLRVEVGRQDAWAYKDPRGKSTMTLSTAALPGVLDARDGVAQAETGVVGGVTRMAKASVDLGDVDLFGGLVKLSHLQWNAVQQTGEDAKAEATFSIGSASIGGVPLLAGTPTATLTALNQVTSQIGLTFQEPTVTQANGVVQITPLVMQLQSSPTQQTILSPALVALQPARQALIAALTSITCYIQTIVTVADVSAGPITGSGAFDLGLGGAAATTEGTRFDNPFGNGFGAGANVLGTQLLPPTAGAASAGLPGTPFVPGTAGLPGTPPSRSVRRGQTAGGILAGARSLPGHTGGWAVLVGFLAVAGVLGMAGADWWRVRRAPGGDV